MQILEIKKHGGVQLKVIHTLSRPFKKNALA